MLRMEIALFLVLSLVAYIYFSAERKSSPLHKTFSVLLVTALVHLVFDALTIYTVNHLDTVPRFLNDTLHRFFIGTMILILYLFYQYIAILVEEETGKPRRLDLAAKLYLCAAELDALLLPVHYAITPQGMSPTLKNIQKCARVLHTLAIIAAVAAFLGAASALAAAVGLSRWYNAPADVLGMLAPIMAELDHGSYTASVAQLSADVISLALDGVVLCFAAAYLKQELADGTPFTASGARSLLRLGILTIALPLISAAVSCVIFGAFDVDISGDYGNGSAIIVGIVLILSSLVFSYGAELEGAKAG